MTPNDVPAAWLEAQRAADLRPDLSESVLRRIELRPRRLPRVLWAAALVVLALRAFGALACLLVI